MPGSELNEREQFNGPSPSGKGTKLMVVADGKGLPLGVSLHPASPLDRLIVDKGYDSDPLRIRLWRQGIEMVCPPRSNKRLVLQDGRALRRFRRRWKIERTIAWLGDYRRVVVRWDRNITIYRAFVQIACAPITCNRL